MRGFHDLLRQRACSGSLVPVGLLIFLVVFFLSLYLWHFFPTDYFYPEDGNRRCHRHIGTYEYLPTTIWHHIPEYHTPDTYCCESLRS
jgi:hypothetical protein